MKLYVWIINFLIIGLDFELRLTTYDVQKHKRVYDAHSRTTTEDA